MTNQLPDKAYAVVYFGSGGNPQICDAHFDGVHVEGRRRAIYTDYADAYAALQRWPLTTFCYGIVPLSTLTEETTVTTVRLRDSVIAVNV